MFFYDASIDTLLIVTGLLFYDSKTVLQVRF